MMYLKNGIFYITEIRDFLKAINKTELEFDSFVRGVVARHLERAEIMDVSRFKSLHYPIVHADFVKTTDSQKSAITKSIRRIIKEMKQNEFLFIALFSDGRYVKGDKFNLFTLDFGRKIPYRHPVLWQVFDATSLTYTFAAADPDISLD